MRVGLVNVFVGAAVLVIEAVVIGVLGGLGWYRVGWWALAGALPAAGLVGGLTGAWLAKWVMDA